MTYFKKICLPSRIEKALETIGFHTPTPIEEQTVSIALSNRDLIGCAYRAPEKTAIYGIPLVTRLSKTSQKSALILAPNRESSLQIIGVLKKLTSGCPDLHASLLSSGVSMRDSRIVVATPNRLVDHLRKGGLSLFSTEILVLDDADRMLEMGFAPQLNEVLRFLPKARQTLLFSKTSTDEVERLASRYLKDPVRMTMDPASEPLGMGATKPKKKPKSRLLSAAFEERECHL